MSGLRQEELLDLFEVKRAIENSSLTQESQEKVKKIVATYIRRESLKRGLDMKSSRDRAFLKDEVVEVATLMAETKKEKETV